MGEAERTSFDGSDGDQERAAIAQGGDSGHVAGSVGTSGRVGNLAGRKSAGNELYIFVHLGTKESPQTRVADGLSCEPSG